jgi:hypothetical protein
VRHLLQWNFTIIALATRAGIKDRKVPVTEQLTQDQPCTYYISPQLTVPIPQSCLLDEKAGSDLVHQRNVSGWESGITHAHNVILVDLVVHPIKEEGFEHGSQIDLICN